MPSPFPGMDPFIERFAWGDFHNTMLSLFRELLAPKVRRRYAVQSEDRVYVERVDTETRSRVPDVAIAQVSSQPLAPRPATSSSTVPVECLVPVNEERRESFLVIRDVESNEIVTIVELLSPTNKREGRGRREYIVKREEILDGPAHLVEIDLLRSGERMPMSSSLPEGDYAVVVSRAELRPRAEAYVWALNEPLPTIRVPLLPEDGDVELSLQAAHDAVYERGFYGDYFDYSAELDPPLDEAERAWVAELLDRV